MSTERKFHKNPSSSTSTIVSVSNPSASIPPSELPEEIIISILKRLPVKSILRFKCVSKDWLSLLSSPNFISIHLQETFKTPLNDSFIISCMGQKYMLNVNSVETEAVSLVNLFPDIFDKMEVVGSVNGLFCLSVYPPKETVTLWNPAMNMYKTITLPITDEDTFISSLGFGYDTVNDDYNIIRMDSLKRSSTEAFWRSRAEVYSVSLDSWKRVNIDFNFHVPVQRSTQMAKGIPYWVGHVYQPYNQYKVTSILMYYDMQNGSFKHVSLPHRNHNGGEQYVEWKGKLGRIVCRGDFVDILVYDEMGAWWNKISSHGPIGLNMWMAKQCSKNGVILAELIEGRLMLYDPVTNWIRELYIPGAPEDIVEAVTYTGSLVTINGTEKVEEQDKDFVVS